MVTRAEVQEMLNEALRRPPQCRPDYPHDGKLRYSRGNPGIYTCECGQRYVKDGKGGLALALALPGEG